MRLSVVFLFVLEVVGILSFALHRSNGKDDECSPLNVDPSQCAAYWSGKENPPLLVVSLDGFRADYLSRENDGQLLAPTINRLARCGVWSPSGMMPSYPTITFPNHFSIVTGLYPESHGIVDNSFFDPEFNVSFSLSSSQQTNPLWWSGEPIWRTARRQNKISATYFWPGSDQTDPLKGPNYWFLYDGNVPYSNRIEKIFQWLKLPVSQRPDLLNLYFSEPDHMGHEHSPNSVEVDEQIREVDQQIQNLLTNLEQEGILGCVNLIILADHGMASTPPGEQFLIMEELVPNITKAARIYDGVIPSIRPHLDTEDERDRIASGMECQDPHMRVYNKWEIPRRRHYFNNVRIPSLLLDMNVGWRAYAKSEYVLPGNHGWDNLNSEMQAVFVAQGPSFSRGLQVRPFHNIDLYNLMCAMVGVDPAPNNGTWGALHHFLATPPSDPTPSPVVPFVPLSYPADQATYDDHLKRNKCDLLTGTNTESIDSTLDLDPASINEAIQKHVPWGAPQFDEERNSIKVVVSRDYVAGFDVVSGLPSWTSYTLDQPRSVSAVKPEWRLDVRLEMDSSSICDRDVIPSSLLVPIFPFGDSATEADVAVDTNAIEISAGFEQYWADFHSKLSQLVASNGEINVVIGPIRDTSSPSLFVIVSNCHTKVLADCSVDEIDVQTFILPTHLKYNQGCIASDDFFGTHLAMLRDVAQITGLHFFPSLSYREQVDLLSRTPFSSQLLANPDPFPQVNL